MFLSSSQKDENQTSWKSKQVQYMKQSARKDRNNILQSQRYLHTAETIDWHVNLNTFKNTVSATYNYYSLIITLFAIGQQVNWRQYVPHMQILISTYHNIIYNKKGSNIQDVVKIQNFQNKFYKLLLLKDLNLHKHLTLLLKMFLAYNVKCRFLNEEKFSQILVEAIHFNNMQTIRQTLWILAQIRINSVCLSKLCKYENLSEAIHNDQSCLIAFLTILANFLSNPSQSQIIVNQLVSSETFQKAFELGLSSKKQQFINQTILIYNNGLCFSQSLRNKLLDNKLIVTRILSSNCKESQKFKEIMTKINMGSMLFNSDDLSGNVSAMNIENTVKFNESLETMEEKTQHTI